MTLRQHPPDAERARLGGTSDAPRWYILDMQPWRATLWLLPGVWALACGGRYQQTVESDDEPSAGARAGSTSSAGSGSSPGCACDPIACVSPFFRAVPDVSGCCNHCELDFTQCLQASDDYRQLRQQLIDKSNRQRC